jgi:hypothetical protein
LEIAMIPFLQWVIARTVARRLTRICVRCGHTQIVPDSLRDQTVYCDQCVAEIPPAR